MQFKNFLALVFCLGFVFLQAQTSGDSLISRGLERDVIITSQFLPTDVRETVNSVRVIDQKTIEQRAAVTLGELLQNEGNMRLTQDAILGTGLNVNGLNGQNIKILIDGVPVIGRLNGTVDAGQLSMVNVQQVEIIEGAQSLLYGSDASAGIINVVTKRSQLHKYEGSLGTQIESIGLNTMQGRIGARYGKFYVQLSGNTFSFNPAIDTTLGRDQLWNPKKNYTGRAMVRYSHSRALDLKLLGSVFDEKIDDFGNMRRPTYKPYSFDDQYSTKRKDVNLSGEGWTKNKWFWKGTVAFNHFDRVESKYRYDFEDEMKSFLGYGIGTVINRGLLTRFTIASDKKNRKLNYLFGVDNQADDIEGASVLNSTATDSSRATRNDFGLFASLKYAPLKNLLLHGGARWTENNLYGTAVTPSLWAKYKPSRSLQIRASYANGFRSPDLLELYYYYVDISHNIGGNTELKPERSHNLRAEVDWAPKLKNKFSVTFSARGFYNKVDDRILLLEIAPLQYQYFNLEQWETLGMGFGFTAKYEKLTFSSQLLRTGFFNSISQELDSLNKFNWAVDWINEINLSVFKNKIDLRLWHKATGSTPFFTKKNDAVVKAATDAWHQINCSANTSILKNRFRINVGVKNLLNIQQIRANNEVFGHNGGGDESPVSWGRSFFISLTAALHSKN